jgi:cobalt-zinc-cadmium efflux system protein
VNESHSSVQHARGPVQGRGTSESHPTGNVHVWEIAEHSTALEAHVVIKKASLPEIERVKTDLKRVLHERFKVSHSTLEMELDGSVCIDTRQADSHRSEA